MDLTQMDDAELARLKADVLVELERRAVAGNLQAVLDTAAQRNVKRTEVDAEYKKAKAEAYKANKK